MTQPLPAPAEEPMPEGVALGLLAFEATVAALVLSLFAAWLATVSAAVLAAFLKFGAVPDPTAIWSTVPMWDKSVDKLIDSLKRIAQTGWEDTVAQLGLQDLPFNPNDPILLDTLQRTRNLMVRTPDEVYRTIVDELAKGHDLNESKAQLAARVRNVLSVTGTENWPARAQTVSVTEVHRAFNFGAIAAAYRAQVRDSSVLTKTWIHKHDLKVRVGHRISQTVPVNQPFIVNEEPLIAPGDPTGSPGNVINCRCKARYQRGTHGRK